VPGRALDAGQGVAQHDVAQVADVGLLVRVDAGVLDDHLAAAGGQVEGAATTARTKAPGST
jgi:hypothetical protein